MDVVWVDWDIIISSGWEIVEGELIQVSGPVLPE